MAELNANGGIYLFKWPEYKISVKLDRFIEDSKFQLTSEATIKTALNGLEEHLHQGRLNLTSTAARDTLIKHLIAKANMLPWATIVEEFATMTLRKYREGEPPIRVKDIHVEEALSFRVRPVMIEGNPNILHGVGGTGKSTLAQWFACLISIPWALHMDRDTDWFKGEPGNVLYLDYETDRSDFKKRISALQHGIEQINDDSEILYRRCFQPLAADQEEIQKIIIEHNIDVVFVDSMGAAVGGDMDKSGDILNLFRALRSFGKTSLIIDHDNKEDKLYGNSYKWNYARNIWQVKATREADGDVLSIGLFHEKANNGKLLKPIGLNLTFAENTTIISSANIADLPDLQDNLPLKDQIKHHLKNGALALDNIMEYLPAKVGRDTVIMTLNRYKGKVFAKVGDNWGLCQRE